MSRTSDPPLIDEALLDALLRAAGPVPVDELARSQHLSVAAVHRRLDQLRAAGCTLEERPEQGIRLVRTAPTTWVDYLRWGDRRRGVNDRVIEVYQRTASTQDVVRRIISERGTAADGAIAAADEQSAGRGRRGNRWVAPAAACVLFSRAWIPGGGEMWDCGLRIADVEEGTTRVSVDRIMFAAAVAIARALETVTAPHTLPITIKWPNDLLVDQRKIAGILVETFAPPATPEAPESPAPTSATRSRRAGTQSHIPSPRAAIIGIGINVDLLPTHLPPNDAALRQRVTSLAMQGRPVDRLRVLSAAVEALDNALAETDPASLIAEWRRRSTLLAQHVRLRNNGTLVQGQVVDLDPYDGLIVRTDTGEMVHLPADTTTVL